MLKLFDTHAHYDDPKFDEDRDEVLRSLPENGVELVIVPGCDLPSSYRAVELAEQYDFVYAAVGCHPEEADSFKDEDIETYRKLAAHPKVVALGEIGLDYYWDENPSKEVQHHVLELQLQLAKETGLPVIIHDREAHQGCLEALEAFPEVKGVFHCYSGSVEFSRILLKKGWYLGFDGPVTYKNAKKNLETASEAPIDRILIETDSPYMAPAPFRGKRNDSRYVYRVAEEIARVRGVTAEEIAEATFENGKRLFGIS